ncbi:MAG TPA: chemotaxis protein CheW, partial [Anaeromyxobacteraceae bacterium]|nr:chemotaxis protein CheW [Anaeromyxobacteraceae bacterium]
MDFLSIRKKARERAEAKEAGAPASDAGARSQVAAEARPAPEPLPSEPAAPAPREERPDVVATRTQRKGTDTILTEDDLFEGALQARFQGLAPSADGRFATWRPGSGPPPVEPDPDTYADRATLAPPPDETSPDVPARAVEPRTAAEPGPSGLTPAPIPALPTDPLDLFFYRPDEEAALLPTLGAVAAEEPVLQRPERLDEFLTFRLGKEEFAVAIDRVREVLRAPSITEVPRAPADVLGVVTVRGEVVPVIDARARLGVAADRGTGGRIVIVDAGEGPLGVLVDEVASVVRLPRGAIEPCPQGL